MGGAAIGLLAPLVLLVWIMDRNPDTGLVLMLMLPVACLCSIFGMMLGRTFGLKLLASRGYEVPDR